MSGRRGMEKNMGKPPCKASEGLPVANLSQPDLEGPENVSWEE